MKKKSPDSVIVFFTAIIGLVVIFMVLRELQHIFIPLVIAYFLFYIFAPLNGFLMKYKIPYTVTILLDLFILGVFFWGTSRIILTSFGELGDQLPLYEEKLNNIISGAAVSLGVSDKFFTDFKLSEVLKGINYGGIAEGFFSSTLSIVSTSVFIVFFYIFVSSGHSRLVDVIKKRYMERNILIYIKELKKELKHRNNEFNPDGPFDTEEEIRLVKSERQIKIEKTFKEITEQIQKYITAKFAISLVTAALVGIVLLIFGVDFLIVWVVISFVLNFIPNIGSVISVLFPTLMVLVQYESVGYSLLFAAVVTVVQNIMGNIIEPKVFGDKLGLNPLVILLSLLLWGYVWGVVGMIISVPLTAVIKIIMSSTHSQNMNFISDLMGN